MKTEISKSLFRKAKKFIPGGVNSPVRAFKAVGGEPIFIASAKGPYLFDEDGNKYIDMINSWGPMILGHAREDVRIRKVEPMNRALRDLGATAWLSGLRREQTEFRARLSHAAFDNDRYKLLPILDWTSNDVYEHLRVNDLPYHPLFDQGYVTVGDWIFRNNTK